MKFTFPKKFQTVYDFNKISVFFNWIVMLFQLTFVSWINCSCNVHLTKKLKSTWMLIGLPDFLCFKIFIFQSFKSVTPFVVQEWYPPTTVVHLQNANPRQLNLLLQAALVQINETKDCIFTARDWRPDLNPMPPISPKYYLKHCLNIIIKFNIQENQVVKNNQDHISSVFSLRIHRQNNKNALR